MASVAALASALTVPVRFCSFEGYGRRAIDQPGWGCFEIEDIMYLVGPIAGIDGLDIFLLLASIGTPIFMVMTIVEYVKGPSSGTGADEKA